MKILFWSISVLMSLPMISRTEDSPVNNLTAEFRHGQVFLTWHESESPAGTTFCVYVSASKITCLSGATQAGHHIEAHSARNWWQDPESFGKDADPKKAGKPIGFVIEDGKPALDPSGGLFVYTVGKSDGRSLYFAVTSIGSNGKEDALFVAGKNTLDSAVQCSVEPIQPVWQGNAAPPAKGAAKKKALILSLHARHGGSMPSDLSYFVLFGDGAMGWRPGLPFTFTLSVKDKAAELAPNDRAWTGGRKDTDDACPAVNTWWYGYQSTFWKSAREPGAGVHNYTERWVLYALHWSQDYLDTDKPATYVMGGSMGGSGAVAMCLHFPGEFAAAVAEVPMVRFTTKPIRTLNRLESNCGPIDDKIPAADGTRLIDHVDGVWQAKNNPSDFPYLFLIHGRTDPVIPWVMNPPFYQALNEAKQGVSIYWNNFGHNDAGRHLPPDVKNWWSAVQRYRLDTSFPVLSDSSDNKNYGKGEPADGDSVGWVNRGLEWKDIVDTSEQYAITVLTVHPDVKFPLTASLTFRRLQRFHAEPRRQLTAKVAGKVVPVTVGQNGLITIPAVTISDRDGVRIELAK